MEPQDGMEVTMLFSEEVQARIGVMGGRVDLESKILPREHWALVWGGNTWGLGSQVSESEAKGQEAGPEI